MTEFFSEVAKRNFTKLQVHVVELFLQDQFVLEFRKVAQRHKGCRQKIKMGRFATQNVIGNTKLNKKVRRTFLAH